MPEILNNEMKEWLHSNADNIWVPMLICKFRDEFGFKRSGIPDSLSVDEAGRLVRLWYK